VAVQYISEGTAASGAAAIAVGLPTTRQTDDLLLLVIETANQAVTLSGTDSANWLQVPSSPQGTGTAAGASATRITVFYRWVDGTEAGVTVNDSGDHQVAQTICYRGVDLTSPFNANAGSTRTTAGTTVTFPSVTTTVDNCRVLLIEAHSLPDSNNTAIVSGHTNANLTNIIEQLDQNTNAGNGGGFSLAEGLKATAGSTGTSTATVTTSSVGGMITLALRPAPEAQDLTPNLYTNGQTFHNPTVTAGTVTLAPDLYTNDQTFFSPDVALVAGVQDLTPALYTNDQTFFSPTAAASYNLTPARYDNAQTFFSPTVAATYELTPARYDNNQTFYSPTVAATYTLTPALYSNAQTFYDPAVTTTVTLAPSLYSNDQTFYSATVSQGAVVLAPDLYTNTQTFFSPVVSTGGALVAPDLYTNTSVFYSATVVAGAVTLTPALYTNGQTFYSPTVASGGATVAPDLYTNTQTFFEPTVAQGAATLSPALYTNTSEFFSPTVARGAVTVAPELHTNTSQFFAAAVAASNQISFDEYVDPGYVTPGYVSPIGFNSQQFFAPTVAPGAIVLTPPLVTNAQTFYAPFVGTGTFNITPLQAKLLYEIYLLHGLAAPLVVGPTSRVAGDVSQTVADNNGTVTVTTTAQPLAAEVEPGLMIEELAALHGLTAPLVVSAATRTAGSISQVFGTAGNATTVTRQ
jgi:hypothetical protein